MFQDFESILNSYFCYLFCLSSSSIFRNARIFKSSVFVIRYHYFCCPDVSDLAGGSHTETEEAKVGQARTGTDPPLGGRRGGTGFGHGVTGLTAGSKDAFGVL